MDINELNIEPITIVILDNHALVRAGLRALINDQAGMKVIGEAGTMSDGLAIIAQQRPDIALLELNLLGQTDYEVVPSLIKASEQTRLILVTGLTDPKIHHKAVEDGAMGVIFKSQQPETLIKAIQKVHAGEVWLERSLIANVLFRRSRNRHAVDTDPEKNSIDQLSEREKEVIRLIGQGYKNKKISTQLCISETTVRHHLSSIYNKVGVSDRLELLVFAHRNGLVTPTN